MLMRSVNKIISKNYSFLYNFLSKDNNESMSVFFYNLGLLVQFILHKKTVIFSYFMYNELYITELIVKICKNYFWLRN